MRGKLSMSALAKIDFTFNDELETDEEDVPPFGSMTSTVKKEAGSISSVSSSVRTEAGTSASLITPNY